MPTTEQWIGHREIKGIDGALSPSAYVGRAYRYVQEQGGELPAWARKQDNGRWQFSREYVEGDAATNLESLGTDEAARILGTTKRTVQTWCDEGVISSASCVGRLKGEARRILRADFMREVPRLRKRIEGAETDVPKDQGKARRATDRDRAAAVDAAPEREVSDKARRAAAVEAQLQNARDTRAEEDRWEKLATASAEKIMNDMFDGQFNRVEAMVLFNQSALDQGVPDEIRVRVRKGFWGK